MLEQNLQLSEEDVRLIEENQLGEPLKVYRLKARYIRFWQWCICIIIGLSVLSFAFVVSDLLSWYPQHSSIGFNLYALPSYTFRSLVNGVSGLLIGGILYCIMFQRSKNEHLIFCEHAALRVTRPFRRSRSEIVFLTDIVRIISSKFDRGEYTILSRDGKCLKLRNYQDQEELIDMLWEQSEALP
ncbi:hypothetical protein [Ktedonobacter racemifer]|nr:hypothetical protein [Ktedonobacter racemifer]